MPLVDREIKRWLIELQASGEEAERDLVLSQTRKEADTWCEHIGDDKEVSKEKKMIRQRKTTKKVKTK